MGVSNVGIDPKESCSSALDCIDLDSVGNVGDSVKEGCDLGVKEGCDLGVKEGCDMGVKEGCDSGVKAGEGSRSSEKGGGEGGNECQGEGSREIGDGRNVVGVECGATSNPEVVVSSRLDKFAHLRGFGLGRCTALKEDGGGNLDAGMDLIKNCSCSFCTKAAYIWADLHYQDAKGRMSAIEKSQKEASTLAQKYSVGSEMGRHVLGNSTDAAQLDTDLMSHWRSLFVHMEDVFVAEASQLQNNFHALKDLREQFKVNLETISGPSDVQQCSSSDASDRTIV